jgi:uncharacterized protein YidB (DUF937 family)
MGLLDVINGMRNGPGGQQQPGTSSGGGMSPITMAILALLAYKGIKHFGGGQPANANPQVNAPAQQGGGGLGDILGGLLGGGSPGAAPGGGLGGGLGGLTGGLAGGGLGGLLGGLLGGGGGNTGNVLSGGLGSLLNQLQQNGHGEAAQSWVGTGPNKQISETDLASALGSDDIDALTRHTGMSRSELLAGLSRELPGAVDELTPDGRMPTGDELSRRV